MSRYLLILFICIILYLIYILIGNGPSVPSKGRGGPGTMLGSHTEARQMA